MAGSGWCTHPKRQDAGGVRLLVRRGELACRDSWGGDLFSSKDSDDDSRSDTAAQQVTDEDQTPPGPIDDEVTSVVTPPGRPTPHDRGSDEPHEDADEDQVVSDRPAPQRDNQRDDNDDGRNDAACNDQDERARLIARGNSDALASARERLVDRKRLGDAKKLGQDRDTAEDTEDQVVLTRATSLPERHNDRATSPQRHNRHRFGKRETFRSDLPTGDQPVPRSEVSRHQREAPTPDRFDSIPEVDPNFDLPGWRRPSEQPPPDAPTDPDPVDDASPVPFPDTPREPETDLHPDTLDPTGHDAGPPVTSYEHVLNRPRRVRGSRNHVPTQTTRRRRQRSELDAEEPVAPAASLDHANADQAPAATFDLPFLADEAPAQSEHVPELESETPSDLQETRHPDRPRGRLAQFGIRRPSEREHELVSRHDAEEWSGYRPSTAGSGSDVDIRPDLPDSDGQENVYHERYEHFAYEAPDEAETPGDYPLPDAGSDALRGPADSHRHEPNTRRPRNHVERAHHNSDYILPDLDALLEARPANPTRPPLAREDHQRDHHAVSASAGPQLSENATSHNDHANTGNRPNARISGSRWSREATPSPRESYFRARRFRDWDHTHPASERQAEASEHTREANGGADHSDLAGNDEGINSHSLPDIDADAFDVREVVDRGGELLDMTIDIASEVPRACRTCRSFQSADGGVRGWCINEWAFTHRRMVNEEDLACDTTIGCWGLPADRYWKTEEPLSWSSGTPKMDRFMNRDTQSPKRNISGD